MKLYITIFFGLSFLMLFSIVQISDDDLRSLAVKYAKVDSVIVKYTDEYRYSEFKNQETGESNYFLYSNDYSQIEGYRGITTIGIILDGKFELNKVVIISSKDTRSYIMRLKRGSFLKQFPMWNCDEELVTVTGATMSSEAVIETVRESCKKFKGAMNNSTLKK